MYHGGVLGDLDGGENNITFGPLLFNEDASIFNRGTMLHVFFPQIFTRLRHRSALDILDMIGQRVCDLMFDCFFRHMRDLII